MPLARKRQISLIDTAYYHCVSRCVRRAYLCGIDALSGQSYEHRRQWVEDRLMFLSNVFAIDVCAFAIMSNHTHLVLHVNQVLANTWSDEEVVEQWHKIHKGTLLTQAYAQGKKTKKAQRTTLNTTIAIYRQRLADISWFMRELNEPIARLANKEDQCTGHFWEGRFKSQALLDEQAITACMAYVDLNPIRANMAKTLNTSAHTSIKRRIEGLKKGCQPTKLMPFIGNPRDKQPHGLPFHLSDYIQLLTLSTQANTPPKLRNIAIDSSDILRRLGVDEAIWQSISHSFEDTFSIAAGQSEALETYKHHTQRKRMPKKAVFTLVT